MNHFEQPQMMRQIIMDHYEYPRNKRVIEGAPSARVNIASCIDDITVFARVEDDQLKDVSFEGIGCTISMASASIMSELVLGKSIDEVNALIAAFKAMVHETTIDHALLKEAIVFKNVGKQANRIQCALMGWQALETLVSDHE